MVLVVFRSYSIRDTESFNKERFTLHIEGNIGVVGQLGPDAAVLALTLEHDLARPNINVTQLWADCSGSMANSIHQVQRDLCATVSELPDGEFVAVGIYSGHGEARLIAGPVELNVKGRELLIRAIEREVHIIGLTVISEPLQRALEAIRTFAGNDTVHSAVLFTDGCVVPSQWTPHAEEHKCFELARVLRDSGAVVSVIGYGVYYDERFIAKLMQEAGNAGIFRHISEIDEFRSVVEEIRRSFLATTPINCSLTFEVKGARVGDVFQTAPQLLSIGKEGSARLFGLHESRATLFVSLIGSQLPTSIAIRGQLNGRAVDQIIAVEPLTDQQRADYVRTIGAWAFLTGDRERAAELFQLTGDAGFSEKTGSAYTEREKRETADIARRMLFERKFIGGGLKASGPNHCVLNVLRALIEDASSVVTIPRGAYKRSGELVRDPRIQESGDRVLTVKGYTSHEDRFNFSLRALKDVRVIPEDGGRPVPRQIWRTYNVILDGNLHLPELHASVSESNFAMLVEAGVIAQGSVWQAGKMYTLNLRNLKLISSAWANPAHMGLVDMLLRLKQVEKLYTAVNAQRRALGSRGDTIGEGDGGVAIYNQKAEKVEDAAREYYHAPCCVVDVMRAKISDLPVPTYASFEDADQAVQELNREKTSLRFRTRAIVFAMQAVGSKVIPWGSPTTTKFGKTERLAQFGGQSLKMTTWTERCVCS